MTYMSKESKDNRPLSSPNPMGGTDNTAATPIQRLAILQAFASRATHEGAHDHGSGLHASEIHSVPGLSALDPRDSEKRRLFVLAEERLGFLAPAGRGVGRTPPGLKLTPKGAAEIELLQKIVKAGQR